VAVDWLGLPLMLDTPSEVCEYCGEVTNSPPGTVDGSPGSSTLATRIQRTPSADS